MESAVGRKPPPGSPARSLAWQETERPEKFIFRPTHGGQGVRGDEAYDRPDRIEQAWGLIIYSDRMQSALLFCLLDQRYCCWTVEKWRRGMAGPFERRANADRGVVANERLQWPSRAGCTAKHGGRYNFGSDDLSK
jgi:hypothetical protein